MKYGMIFWRNSTNYNKRKENNQNNQIKIIKTVASAKRCGSRKGMFKRF
jgi:hypothetical protein